MVPNTKLERKGDKPVVERSNGSFPGRRTRSARFSSDYRVQISGHCYWLHDRWVGNLAAIQLLLETDTNTKTVVVNPMRQQTRDELRP